MAGTPETQKSIEPSEVESSSQKWEYQVRYIEFKNSVFHNRSEDELNKLGKEGWELAGVVVKGSIYGVSFGSGGGGFIESALIFKRPKL